MKRLKEEFLDKTEDIIPLVGMDVLEIGCGTGIRSAAIAKRCKSLVAIEPEANAIATARENNAAININYQQGSAAKLDFKDKIFDVIIFTLSFHHIPFSEMNDALNEAVRVTKIGGHIVFLEPAHTGTYFESEIMFDAGDGDERAEKARAYSEILLYEHYTEVSEIGDETIFQLDSIVDFIDTFKPKKNLESIEKFLQKHNFILNAERRINIFKV